MFDDLLEDLFQDGSLQHSASRRLQLWLRLFFGLLGAGLGVAGAVHFAVKGDASNGMLRATIILLFLALAAFFLCNVALGRKWGWPPWLFALSFAGVFIVRILFGP